MSVNGLCKTKLFVTGMFRSGTTMLARMLASHGDMAFASDPFSRIFKSLRNSLAEHTGQEIDPASPLDDYYFSPQGIQLLAATRSVSWSTMGTRLNGEEIANAASIASIIRAIINDSYGRLEAAGAFATISGIMVIVPIFSFAFGGLIILVVYFTL